MDGGSRSTVAFTVDGAAVEVPSDAGTLLDALRDHLGARSPKDGCSPQGQCGCCTVLVDGQPRVSCVTPVRRVAGRAVTTVDGLPEVDRDAWADAFCDAGASQCGFCTPGILVRLEGLRARGVAAGDHGPVEQALLAHLCRCTGWRSILDAWDLRAGAGSPVEVGGGRDLGDASARATLEGRAAQVVDPSVALGRGGFAADTVPDGALVAVPDGAGGWAVGETLAAARAVGGKVQGRRTTVDPAPPLEAPAGDWAATLRTSWVEPAYLEVDASWCEPGGEPASPLANGGAVGGKVDSVVTRAARELADEHGRPVRVVLDREWVARWAPKRPPIAAGARADGSGILRVATTPGICEAIRSVAPDLEVEEVAVPGPPTSASLRAAGWAEAVVLLSGARGRLNPVTEPGQGTAEAALGADGTVRVRVDAGEPLDEVVLRSYVTGAAHMALSWVSSEGLAVDDGGEVHDLTIRSFGVLRAVDMPPVEVEVTPSSGPPVRASDAAFAAVAAAAWLHVGCPSDWPTGHRWR
jgi:xanthine dehydrogenase small subunit